MLYYSHCLHILLHIDRNYAKFDLKLHNHGSLTGGATLYWLHYLYILLKTEGSNTIIKCICAKRIRAELIIIAPLMTGRPSICHDTHVKIHMMKPVFICLLDKLYS